VVDVFTRMLCKAAAKGYLVGLMNRLYPEGVISLQYANDTLLFLGNDSQGASHLKWPMTLFEYLSSLRINYHKSDLIAINLDEQEVAQVVKKICCKLGAFPFKYLGVPLHYDFFLKKKIYSLQLIRLLIGSLDGRANCFHIVLD
jgi:hypothetical protein